MSDTVIETVRTRLRLWRPQDAGPFAAMNADPEVMRHFPAVLAREQSDAFLSRIQAHFDRHGFGLWALEVRGDDSFAGFVGLSVPGFSASFTPCVEIGWRVARAHWGHGYVTEAGRAALRHGFEILKLPEIVSFTVRVNDRSWRVMERLGMHRDPADDFDHPSLPEGHRLRRHLLYRLTAAGWAQSSAKPFSA